MSYENGAQKMNGRDKQIQYLEEFLKSDEDEDFRLTNDMILNELLADKGGVAEIEDNEDNLPFNRDTSCMEKGIELVRKVERLEREARIKDMNEPKNKIVEAVATMVKADKVVETPTAKPNFVQAIDGSMKEFLEKNGKELDAAVRQIAEVRVNNLKVEVERLLNDSDESIVEGCDVMQKGWVKKLWADYCREMLNKNPNSTNLVDEFSCALMAFDDHLVMNELCKAMIDSQSNDAERLLVLVRSFFQTFISGGVRWSIKSKGGVW